jgi:hypothetical protein
MLPLTGTAIAMTALVVAFTIAVIADYLNEG